LADLGITPNASLVIPALETPKHHFRCNHTRALHCRIFYANHTTSTALHIRDDRIVDFYYSIYPVFEK